MILSKKDSVMKYLTELTDLVFVFTEEEIKLYEIQVRKMMIDNTLPAATDDNGDDADIVKWYSHLSKKYPAVHKMAMSVLSIFHGPKVESRFSATGGVIDKKTNRMCDRTYSVIQTVKYPMRDQCPNSSSSQSIQLFKRQDKHYTPVSSTLANNVRNAYCLQKQTLSEKEAVTRYGHWVWKGDEPQQEDKKTGSRGEQQQGEGRQSRAPKDTWQSM